jgi:hypothetical protein
VARCSCKGAWRALRCNFPCTPARLGCAARESRAFRCQRVANEPVGRGILRPPNDSKIARGGGGAAGGARQNSDGSSPAAAGRRRVLSPCHPPAAGRHAPPKPRPNRPAGPARRPALADKWVGQAARGGGGRAERTSTKATKPLRSERRAARLRPVTIAMRHRVASYDGEHGVSWRG